TDRVEYLAFQDPEVNLRFPEIPSDEFEAAVHLITPDGSVYTAAEAAYRALAFGAHGDWAIDLYQHSPAFAAISESAYRFVARHRPLFSFITRMLWGQHVEPPSHVQVRWAFLRSLGIIYLLAFASLLVQIVGLAGHNGIVPAEATMKSA